MNRPLSVYLDAVRFLAAAVVLLSHTGSQSMSGGFLWQCMRFGTPAIVVFFVLSGFVIRHATQQTTTARDYVVSRAARIYSVVLPTLGLTFLLDLAGSALRPDLYTGVHSLLDDPRTLPAALTFLSCAWGGADWSRVGSNCSYWSLGYEVPYYVLFGFLVFGRGSLRVIGVLATAALTGPTILLLSPLWFLGVGTHWLCERWKLGPWLSWALFLGSGATVLWVAAMNDAPVSLEDHSGADLAMDAIVGIAFAANIVGCRSLPPNMLHRALQRFEQPIRWLAGSTFTLYLLHMPMAMFFKSLAPWSLDSWQFRTGLILTPLLASLALAQVTERKKHVWRRLFAKALPERTGLGPTVPVGHPAISDASRTTQFPRAARAGSTSGRRNTAG